jgi:hypothetical protein
MSNANENDYAAATPASPFTPFMSSGSRKKEKVSVWEEKEV